MHQMPKDEFSFIDQKKAKYYLKNTKEVRLSFQQQHMRIHLKTMYNCYRH